RADRSARIGRPSARRASRRSRSDEGSDRCSGWREARSSGSSFRRCSSEMRGRSAYRTPVRALPAGALSTWLESCRVSPRRGIAVVTNVANLLHNVPIFSDCSPKDLAAVARGLKEVNHKAGTVIAREGEPGVGLFVIVEGEAKVTIGDKPRRTLGPGEFF